MVFFVLFGIRICVDFTAPFLLGMLSLTLPPETVMQTAVACILHETAHILTVFCTNQRPQQLSVSAAGMQMRVRRGAVCPTKAYAFILLSGPIANLLAGSVFLKIGLPDAAAAHLSLCAFNLLPVSGTDGGSLLRLHLDHRYMTCPEKAVHTARLIAVITALTVLAFMHISEYRNLSLLVMTVYLTLTSFCSD